MKKLSYNLITVLSICGYTLNAQTNYNITTTAVPFLRISTDARATGMGSTGIATSPDVTAIQYNVAKLPFAKSNASINANYSPWLKEWANDMYIASLAGYYKLNDNEAVHGLVKYFNPGDLQFTDNSGNHLQSYHPNEFAIDLGYSRKLSDKIGVGIGIKYIRSDLAHGTQNGESYKAANAIATDLGFYYDLRKSNQEGWSFGIQFSNLGSKIHYTESATEKDYLPANLGLGASYTRVFDDQNRISFAFDINKLLVPAPPVNADSMSMVNYRNKSIVSSWFSSFNDAGFKDELKAFQLSIGAEYWYNNQFALRVGYYYEDKTKGDRKSFSAGFSASYNVFTLNFSYMVPTSNSVNKSPLTNTMLFGVNISLDK